MSTKYYGMWANYICFGTAYGYFSSPRPPFTTTFMDVHGAGAQRSDPKYDDGTNYGHGPQGDVVRIYNHVRCVCDAGPKCGDYNHPFPVGDHTKNCYVDLNDFPGVTIETLMEFAKNWLTCTSPDAPCSHNTL